MIPITIKAEFPISIFVLEDDDQRIAWFRQKFDHKNVTLVIVKRANLAITELQKQVFDVLFLDHDLDDKVFVDSHEELDAGNWNTGYQVAKVLRDTINCDTPCIVHSMNPDGAANMTRAHPFNTYHIPFHILKQDLVVDYGQN